MAAIKIRCTRCRQKLSLSDEMMGRKIKCPGCKSRLHIPQELPAKNSSSHHELQAQNTLLKQQAVTLEGKIAQLEQRIEESNDKIRKSLAMPRVQSSPSSANGIVRQNAALQRRVDALNMELDDKARALSGSERRNRELEDEIKFLKETAHLQEKARSSINSFIQNVERNESPTASSGLKTTSRKR